MVLLRKLLRHYCLTPNTIRYRIEFRCIERALEKIKQPVDTLVDLGAGSGVMTLMAAGKVQANQVIGLEPFPGNFQLLQETFQGKPNCKALSESILEIPLDDQSADLVISTQVFEHVEEHEKAAAEVDRILKPGGHAIISTPHPPEMFPNDEHVRPGYTQEEMLALFAPFNFEPVITEYFFTLDTLKALRYAGSLPFRGRFLPIAFADREAKLTNEQRRQQQPYGILVMFQKPE